MPRIEPRGSIVFPTRPLPVDCGHTVGRMPAIIVRVKSSSRMRREFRRFCAHLGINAVQLDDGTFECGCVVPPLARLAEHPAVIDFHLIVKTK